MLELAQSIGQQLAQTHAESSAYSLLRNGRVPLWPYGLFELSSRCEVAERKILMSDRASTPIASQKSRAGHPKVYSVLELPKSAHGYRVKCSSCTYNSGPLYRGTATSAAAMHILLGLEHECTFTSCGTDGTQYRLKA